MKTLATILLMGLIAFTMFYVAADQVINNAHLIAYGR